MCFFFAIIVLAAALQDKDILSTRNPNMEHTPGFSRIPRHVILVKRRVRAIR